MTHHPQHVLVPAPAPTNALGVAGFVCSLVGLVFTGGLLCPIGLVLSLVALGRPPRGFAWAGLILGLLGTCGWGLLIIFAGGMILAALGLAAVVISLSETERVEITSDMANMVIAIKSYEQENRYLPATLDDLPLKSSTRLDPWGRRYDYHLQEDEPGFDIVSAGEDGAPGTDDDVRLTALGEAWRAAGMDMDIEAEGDDDGGRVRIRIGGATIGAQGDAEGGRVEIDLGEGRVLEIEGDGDAGGESEPE